MRLVWTGPALDDLREIRDYLSPFSRASAMRVVDTIRAKAKRLRDWPFSAPLFEDTAVRKLSISEYPYLVFYIVTGTEVHILRVRHAMRDTWRP